MAKNLKHGKEVVKKGGKSKKTYYLSVRHSLLGTYNYTYIIKSEEKDFFGFRKTLAVRKSKKAALNWIKKN